MTLRGTIKKGKIVLNSPALLPDGTEVEVRAVKNPRKAPKAKAPRSPRKRSTLAEAMAPFKGVIKGLPPDMSVNLDHYLYGTPKRS